MCKMVFVFVFCFQCFCAESVIISTDNINDIEDAFKKAGEQTLVALDCNEILIEFTDLILTEPYQKIKATIKKEIKKGMQYDKIQKLDSIVLMNADTRLLNNRWPDLINRLQEKNVKVISLTTCGANKFGDIPSMSDFRLKELQKHKIDFTKPWNNLKEKITFSPMKQTLHAYPEYSNPSFVYGMLFADRADKGTVLEIFLKQLKNCKITKVIFVDDKIKNVESVKKAMHKMQIDFIGIEYTYAKSKDCPKLNEINAKKQYEILLKEHKWISDLNIESYQK